MLNRTREKYKNDDQKEWKKRTAVTRGANERKKNPLDEAKKTIEKQTKVFDVVAQ